MSSASISPGRHVAVNVVQTRKFASDSNFDRVRKLMDVAVAEGPVLEALFESLKSVVPNAKLEGVDTKLLGIDAVVDSVGFLGFLMSAESALGNTVDLSALLIEAGDVPPEESPFRTVGSLANYIEQVRSY